MLRLGPRPNKPTPPPRKSCSYNNITTLPFTLKALELELSLFFNSLLTGSYKGGIFLADN